MIGCHAVSAKGAARLRRRSPVPSPECLTSRVQHRGSADGSRATTSGDAVTVRLTGSSRWPVARVVFR